MFKLLKGLADIIEGIINKDLSKILKGIKRCIHGAITISIGSGDNDIDNDT